MDAFRWLARPPVAITVAILLFSVAVYVQRDYKAADILSSLQITAQDKHTVVVTAGVELEAFHMERLQSHGTMLKVDGRAVLLRAVTTGNLEWLARQPWVASIEMPDEDAV